MGYCVTSDIQADFKSTTFSGTSLVTDTAVAQFITEASALIDSYVGNRYVTPVTADANALALLKMFCRILVSDRVRGILENKQTTATDGNQNVRAGALSSKDVMKSLIDIQQGNAVLTGAALINASASFFSNNNSNGVQPVFSKDCKQW